MAASPPPLSPGLQHLAAQLASAGTPTTPSVLEPTPEAPRGSRMGCGFALFVAALDITVIGVALSMNHAVLALTGLTHEDAGDAIVGLSISGVVVALIGTALAGVNASHRAAARPRVGRARGVVIDRGWMSRPAGTTLVHQGTVVVRYEVEGESYAAPLRIPGVMAASESGPPESLPETMTAKLGDVVEIFYEPGNFGNVALEGAAGGSLAWQVIGLLLFGLVGCGMLGMALALFIDFARS